MSTVVSNEAAIAPVTEQPFRLSPDISPRVELGGCLVDLTDEPAVVAAVITRGQRRSGPPLSVISANLDHLHQFGQGSRWGASLEQARARGEVEMLTLLDGRPLVTESGRLTGITWPRLAGSDLIAPILAAAEVAGVTVGFLGGSEETHVLLRQALVQRWPLLQVRGCWAPPRETIEDPAASRRLAAEVAAAGVDILVVCLGKPRQELWIAEHGVATGAGALLAFGAVVDFLAGRVSRAPSWVADAGIEWAYRLVQEPRRLYRRYLVQGPPAYRALRRSSAIARPGPDRRPAAPTAPTAPTASPALQHGTLSAPQDGPDVTAVIITHNSAAAVTDLIDDLRRDAARRSIAVIVVDNDSTDKTVALVEDQSDVTLLRAGGNLGYAGGINLALGHVDRSSAVLVLNPDLRLGQGALDAMRERLDDSGVGVVVPRLVDADGSVAPSLRFEPTPLRTLGDALLGAHLSGRPDWATEIDWDTESYRHPHAVEWATGACLLVRADVLAATGPWDERYFLYSEEVDYLRRVRLAGWAVWFEPSATAFHEGGGSGGSPELAALEAVNRVRYVEAVHGPRAAALVRTAALLGELLRVRVGPDHRRAATYLLSRRSWSRLPAASRSVPSLSPPTGTVGSVVVPAHNEEAVIERTLAPLAALTAARTIEVVVAANGCHDATAALARELEHAAVLELRTPSKVAALNAADAVAQHFPRLYLDADIDITADTVLQVLRAFDDPRVLAARPEFRYDTSEATWPVQAYYRARRRLPECHEHLWGAGAYALSRAGHDRLGCFPDLVADDVYVDALFGADEKLVVATEPVVVRTPSDLVSLLAVLRRVHGGNQQIRTSEAEVAPAAATTGRTLRQLVRSATGPGRLADATAYAVLTILARLQSRHTRASHVWERDDSSRLRGAA